MGSLFVILMMWWTSSCWSEYFKCMHDVLRKVCGFLVIISILYSNYEVVVVLDIGVGHNVM